MIPYRSYYLIAWILFSLSGFFLDAHAATITAQDASFDEVRKAIELAGRGGAVIIPPRSGDWDATLTITHGVTIVGHGTDTTTINNSQSSTQWSYAIVYAPDSEAETNNERFDISKVRFTTSGGEKQACLKIMVDSTSPVVTNVRIHDNFFDGGTDTSGWMYKAIEFAGAGCGVVDNNIFRNARKALNSYGTQQGTWDAFYPAPLGSVQNVYFEDNTILNTVNVSNSCCSGVASSGAGGRIVIRFNTWNGVFGYSLLDAHGNQGSGVVGSLLQESYFNTISFDSESHRFADHRGGQGLYFFNVSTSPVGYSQDFTIRDEHSDSLPPDVIGTEHVHDSYFFMNKLNGAEVEPVNDIDVEDLIDENEAYWIYNASFNGESGVGVGPRSSMPTTCTEGVAYWATDEGEWNSANPGHDGRLYRCASADTWEAYYMPFTYPHPLRKGGDPDNISAPTGLRIVQ